TTAVERDESGAEPGRDDRCRTCHEITGLFGHARFAPLAIITGLRPRKFPFLLPKRRTANRLPQITGTNLPPGVRPGSDPPVPVQLGSDLGLTPTPGPQTQVRPPTAPGRTPGVRRSRRPSPGPGRKWPP